MILAAREDKKRRSLWLPAIINARLPSVLFQALFRSADTFRAPQRETPFPFLNEETVRSTESNANSAEVCSPNPNPPQETPFPRMHRSKPSMQKQEFHIINLSGVNVNSLRERQNRYDGMNRGRCLTRAKANKGSSMMTQNQSEKKRLI